MLIGNPGLNGVQKVIKEESYGFRIQLVQQAIGCGVSTDAMDSLVFRFYQGTTVAFPSPKNTKIVLPNTRPNRGYYGRFLRENGYYIILQEMIQYL